MEFLAAGNAEDARAEFSAALEVDATHVPSRLQLAHLDEARGDWTAAVAGFNEVVALDPSQVVAWVRLAHLIVLAKDSRRAAAERYARKAFELAPEDSEVLAALALVAYGDGDSGAASAWASRSLDVDPDDWTARLVKARVAADAGETDAALEWLDGLLAERPADREVSILKSQVLSSGSREAALRMHLAHMAEIFSDPWIKEWLAYLREQVGDAAGAYVLLDALTKQQPGEIQAALDVIDFVRRNHGAEAARNEFGARIAAADPVAALQLRLELAAFEDAEGRPEEAGNVLSGLIAEAPGSIAADTARLRIARRHLTAGKRDEARRLVDVVLERDRRRPDALALHASLLLDEGNADEAIQVLRVGLEEAPDDLGLTLALARAYGLAGRPELAKDRYEAAAQISDFDPGVVTAYVDFLLNSDRTEAAIYVLEAAAYRHPDNTDIRARLDAARSRKQID